jgi:hypothetical protein
LVFVWGSPDLESLGKIETLSDTFIGDARTLGFHPVRGEMFIGVSPELHGLRSEERNPLSDKNLIDFRSSERS